MQYLKINCFSFDIFLCYNSFYFISVFFLYNDEVNVKTIYKIQHDLFICCVFIFFNNYSIISNYN